MIIAIFLLTPPPPNMPPPLAASMTNPRSGQHQASCIAGKGQQIFWPKKNSAADTIVRFHSLLRRRSYFLNQENGSVITLTRNGMCRKLNNFTLGFLLCAAAIWQRKPGLKPQDRADSQRVRKMEIMDQGFYRGVSN